MFRDSSIAQLPNSSDIVIPTDIQKQDSMNHADNTGMADETSMQELYDRSSTLEQRETESITKSKKALVSPDLSVELKGLKLELQKKGIKSRAKAAKPRSKLAHLT